MTKNIVTSRNVEFFEDQIYYDCGGLTIKEFDFLELMSESDTNVVIDMNSSRRNSPSIENVVASQADVDCK